MSKLNLCSCEYLPEELLFSSIYPKISCIGSSDCRVERGVRAVKLSTGNLFWFLFWFGFVFYSITQLTKLTPWPHDPQIQPTGNGIYHLGGKAQLHQISYKVQLHSCLFSRLSYVVIIIIKADLGCATYYTHT